MAQRPEQLEFDPKFLFLTEDTALLDRQLQGESVDISAHDALMSNISTDEITPGWVCFYYDQTLGDYCLVGLRGEVIQKDSVKTLGASIIVSGDSKGCGSSRETAPYSEQAAGAQLIIARSIEKIYGQNCLNIGLLTSTDFGLIDRIKQGEKIPLEEFTADLDPISADILRQGGLFPYNQARLSGLVSPPALSTPERPMNLVEKIIARHVVADAQTGQIGVTAVKPGDAAFVKVDVRFSHEYVTPMASALFTQYLGEDTALKDPQSIYAFRDHLTFIGQVMPEKRRQAGFLDLANNLADVQERFAQKHGIRLYGEVDSGGSEAICHNAVLDDIGLPGQIILGSDSHTCTAGALGAFAFGVGSTDLANSWYTGDTKVKVPQVVRFDLTGELPLGTSGKDLMLYIMSQPYLKNGQGIGQVLEFGGPGLKSLPFDERATLSNMAVEAGGFTGIMEADDVVVEHILKHRPGMSAADIEQGFLQADDDAEYVARFSVDLSELSPMVALPGDPRNGVLLSDFIKEQGEVKVNIAYGGSCTGGKMADMDMYAKVLKKALAKGQKVHPDVELYIQFGSQNIKQYANTQGYLEVFEQAGAKMIDPSCGACINAGPGVSKDPHQVTVSAINRNFPGRSGPGQVYLASPYVVAASAVAGKIADPAKL